MSLSAQQTQTLTEIPWLSEKFPTFQGGSWRHARRFQSTRGVGVARFVRAPSRVMICEDCHREATIATKRATCAPLVEEASCAWCGYLRSSYAQRESRRLMTGWTETISFKLPPPPLPRNCNNNNNLLKTRVASAISRDGNTQYKIKYVMESYVWKS